MRVRGPDPGSAAEGCAFTAPGTPEGTAKLDEDREKRDAAAGVNWGS